MSIIDNFLNKLTAKTKHTQNGKKTDTWSGAVRKNSPLRECPFVVFDTELSGLDPRKDFIISIGAIKMTGGTIHINKEMSRLVRPEGEMSKKNVEIHGITPGELEEKESLEAVLPDFLDFIKDSVLVGHFINIDIKFMNRALKKIYSMKLANPALDTHSIHEWLYENGVAFKKHYQGGSTKTDLFSVSQRYGITVDTAHDALNDAFVTAQLFQRFLYFLHAESMHTLNDLLDIGRA